MCALYDTVAGPFRPDNNKHQTKGLYQSRVENDTGNSGLWSLPEQGGRCSSVVRAFTHGAMGRRIDPSWGGPIELFLVPARAPRLV